MTKEQYDTLVNQSKELQRMIDYWNENGREHISKKLEDAKWSIDSVISFYEKKEFE